jgi:sensor histidine kinase regulating citrate/malate metabolism
MATLDRFSIVEEQNFIIATRDTGYRTTASAVSELVDNALQASAKHVRIFVTEEGVGVDRNINLAVLDDGSGMNAGTLRTALRFGGSSRFNDRSGQGRFGMELPNSSVSQARRLDVYTWQKPDDAVHSYIDVDEIASGRMREGAFPEK